jgi:hypothetical protein
VASFLFGIRNDFHFGAGERAEVKPRLSPTGT